MTAVAIIREETEAGSEGRFRAIVGSGIEQSIGRTAGEALDALTMKLSEEDSGTLVVVQQMRPDRWFTADQIRRLQHLMEGSRTGILSAEEQSELHTLIDAELFASAKRAESLARSVGR